VPQRILTEPAIGIHDDNDIGRVDAQVLHTEFQRIAFAAAREISQKYGLEIGAISIATTVSDYCYEATPRRDWRTFVVRKQAKDHGLGKLIEGAVRSGDHALIVDDVLTSGGALLKAIAAAREAGLVVSQALVIVDRKEQDGRARVEQEGVSLISLLTIEDLRRQQVGTP